MAINFTDDELKHLFGLVNHAVLELEQVAYQAELVETDETRMDRENAKGVLPVMHRIKARLAGEAVARGIV